MNTIETKIRDARLTETPESLDRSIEQMVRWAAADHNRRTRYRKPLWFAATGCAAGLLIGIFLGSNVSGDSKASNPPSATVVTIEPTPELERWVTAGNPRPQRGFFERTHTELETVYIAGKPPQNRPNSL